MNIGSSIIRDEVKELEYDMSVKELIDLIDSDNILIAIQIVLEEIAIERIIDRTQALEEMEKRGKIVPAFNELWINDLLDIDINTI